MQTSKIKSRHRVLRFERIESRCLLSGVHAGNPVLAAEHEAVMNLVPDSAVTHRAIASGEWDDPAIWDYGVPGPGSNVLIKDDIDVLIDSILSDPMRTVRVDGTLRFATDVNSELRVDTLIVTPSGALEIGSDAQPVHQGVTAKIIIVDSGPIDLTWDPHQFSRSLISHGQIEIHGAETTPFVALTGSVSAGSTQIVLSSVPIGWDVGERIIVTGTNRGSTHDVAEIESISGRTVTLTTPLAFDHNAPAGQSIYVGNLSRSIIIQSENAVDQSQRGHVMFMHSPHVDIDFAGFYGLGRTDKRNPLNNVELHAGGQILPGTGKNQNGRYSVHFHRTNGAEPASIQGSVVVDSPGWGIVNHSGNVSVQNNIVFDVVGAAFVTEAGDEIGDFIGNLATYSQGSGDGTEFRNRIQDFGHEGDGFWLQGPGVRVENNVASGHKHSAFVYFTKPLNQPGLGVTKFLAANLADPSIANGQTTIDVGSVPIRSFAYNVAYASGEGLEMWFHLLGAKHSAQSIIEEFDGWNLGRSGIFMPYTNHVVFENVTLIGNTSQPAGTGIAPNHATQDITYLNVNISGFLDGLRLPAGGVNRIDGGSFDNVNNILIQNATMDRVIEFTGDIKFPISSLHNIQLTTNFDLPTRDIAQLFNRDMILLDTVKFNGLQLYYLEQSATFVPFKARTAPDWIPQQLVGKTNQQLFDMYGLAIGGAIAPANALSHGGIRGLVGAMAIYQPHLEQVSRVYVNDLKSYKLSYRNQNGHIQTSAPVPLHEGWNLLTRSIDGNRRTFFVYGDITPPTFQLTSANRINPLDLNRGLLISGRILDDSSNPRNFSRKVDNLTELVRQRANGSQYMKIYFYIDDRAGNVTRVRLTVNVDSKAPRQSDTGTRK